MSLAIAGIALKDEYSKAEKWLSAAEDNFNNFEKLVEALHPKYQVLFNKDLTLYTVRHFRQEDLDKLEKGQTVLLKQLSRETAQLVVREHRNG